MSESPETQSGVPDARSGVPERLQRLKELTEFTENCKKQLDDMFEELGWSKDYNYNQDAMEQCPYDANHRVPVTSMERHKASCSRRKMGYSAEEEAEMFDPSVCYENSGVRSFTTDKSTQHQVILQARSAAPLMRMEGVFWQGQYSGQPVDVPQNHKRAVCDLTVADRLALYDHVVGVLSQRREAASCSNEDLYVDLVSKLQKDEEQNEPKTHLELMAEMRDYKRRRQSYRAKNVHITKKSYTEVIREVIKVHSGELTRQWREDEDEEESTRSELSSHRRRPEEKRPASSESRHSLGQRRRGSRERSPERESKKKKRKRERDSGSPEEHHHHHHHDRKKKKKKKREEREKEK
ncbi:U11/U12 small nuclear ribonucleoprotein 48 kDa protein isoform X1 [Cyclopterus lumpus]|uniref:U11/U12 small nuclear ribonucleoprotein 48 kDa protein isoform X1 n=1 Tax=Cyclopterus lumpus TaxID=8103 RepID=UPI0014861B8A|nr:U11/U12 small nuclear ribonucleoprotein 48 kDa protein isoform X1 [Cyclopterus lumpus]